jgi:hypothetical protein
MRNGIHGFVARCKAEGLDAMQIIERARLERHGMAGKMAGLIDLLYRQEYVDVVLELDFSYVLRVKFMLEAVMAPVKVNGWEPTTEHGNFIAQLRKEGREDLGIIRDAAKMGDGFSEAVRQEMAREFRARVLQVRKPDAQLRAIEQMCRVVKPRFTSEPLFVCPEAWQ